MIGSYFSDLKLRTSTKPDLITGTADMSTEWLDIVLILFNMHTPFNRKLRFIVPYKVGTLLLLHLTDSHLQVPLFGLVFDSLEC